MEEYIECEFLVEGMHCAACELVIEKRFSKFKGVRKVNAQLDKEKVYLEIDKSINNEKIRKELNQLIENDGYKLVTSRIGKHNIDFKELTKALIIAAIFMGLFLLLQKLGVVNLINIKEEVVLPLPFIFLIGIVASFSTCMAVVGGLVLSLSSNYAKGKQIRPLVFFHLSRVIGFFILGGVIGQIGSAFTLSDFMSFILNLILFFVMIVMAINLLDILPFARKLQFKIPKFLGRNVFKINETNNVLTPLLLGVSTFVLPCGFTQAMQIQALKGGTFINGALIMLIFALGTLPVLALISFASTKLSKTFQSGLFFKSAGFIIIFFAIFNFIAALTAVGIIKPLFNI